MKKVLSVENMRKSDFATINAGIPSKELMYRAGEGIFNVIKAKGIFDSHKKQTIIFCGTGNNAGDGYVIALLLKREGYPVKLVLVADKYSEDGRYYYDQCVSQGIEIELFDKSGLHNKEDKINGLHNNNNMEVGLHNRYDCNHANGLHNDVNKGSIIIDCLLGTGFKGAPREEMRNVISYINGIKDDKGSEVYIISVDINSGLNGDNGLYELCVKSDLTISIGGNKPGLLLNKAKDVIKELVNIEIGIEPIEKPYYLFEKDDARSCLPKRLNDSNKGSYGYIALIGGSSKYTGAISLAAMSNAAMRSGAGVVLVAAPNSVCPYIIPRILESTIYPLSDVDGEVSFNESELSGLVSRVKVIAFGMGIGRSIESRRILEYILMNFKGTLIIDADGLNCLSELLCKPYNEQSNKVDDITIELCKRKTGDLNDNILKNSHCKNIILTPHIKEFSRLCNESVGAIKENPIDLSKSFVNAMETDNLILLLKGPTTIVTDGKEVLLIDKGCPGMATAGSGDVLSGIMAAVCGYNQEKALAATATAAFINGMAGMIAEERMGAISMIASDTVVAISDAIKKICNFT